MTSERAKYVLANRTFGGTFRYAFPVGYAASPVEADGITREEYQSILQVWDRLPGWTSFFDAVCEIAHGRGIPLSENCLKGNFPEPPYS